MIITKVCSNRAELHFNINFLKKNPEWEMKSHSSLADSVQSTPSNSINSGKFNEIDAILFFLACGNTCVCVCECVYGKILIFS